MTGSAGEWSELDGVRDGGAVAIPEVAVARPGEAALAVTEFTDAACP